MIGALPQSRLSTHKNTMSDANNSVSQVLNDSKVQQAIQDEMNETLPNARGAASTPFRLLDFVQEAHALWAWYWRRILGVGLYVQLPVFAVLFLLFHLLQDIFVDTDQRAANANDRATGLALVVVGAVVAFATVPVTLTAVCRATAAGAMNAQNVSKGKLYSLAFVRLPTVSTAIVFYTLGVLIGSVLFVLPGIFFAGRYCLAIPTAALENGSFFQSVAQAKRLFASQWMVFISVFTLLIALLSPVLILLSTYGVYHVWAGAATIILLQVWLIYAAVMLTVMYCRFRKYADGSAFHSRVFSRALGFAPPPEKDLESRANEVEEADEEELQVEMTRMEEDALLSGANDTTSMTSYSGSEAATMLESSAPESFLRRIASAAIDADESAQRKHRLLTFLERQMMSARITKAFDLFLDFFTSANVKEAEDLAPLLWSIYVHTYIDLLEEGLFAEAGDFLHTNASLFRSRSEWAKKYEQLSSMKTPGRVLETQWTRKMRAFNGRKRDTIELDAQLARTVVATARNTENYRLLGYLDKYINLVSQSFD